MRLLWCSIMAQSQPRQGIPTKLSKEQFEQFILPHLSKGSRGPETTLSFHAIFNYILCVLYLGCQWKQLPIEKDRHGRRRDPLHKHLPHLSALASRGLF